MKIKLVSRAVDANGTYTATNNTVTLSNEIGKVEVLNAPTMFQVGSVVKFDLGSEDEYTVKAIETDFTLAKKQIDTITVDTAVDGDYIITVTNLLGAITPITYTADVTGLVDTVDTIAAGLGNLLEAFDTSATNISVTDNVITITASVAGVPMTNVVYQGAMTLLNTQANVMGDSYELVFDTTTDFASMLLDGKTIYVKDSAINAIVTAPKVGGLQKSAAELKAEAIYIPNEDEYSVMEMSIPVYGDDKLKFFAKSSGSEMNGIEIAIANEADFTSGTQYVFPGLLLNSFFETKPSLAQKEIAVLIRKDGVVTGSYIVSLVPGSKDFRNKSNYIEDVINKYDTLVYVKDNTGIVDMPASKLNTSVLILSNGTDGEVNMGDIALAYGSVSDNTIFGKNVNNIDYINYAA